jgi:hypothetical protein
MSRRFRTLEILTAADLAKSSLAREQERTARDVANTNRWIGALSNLIPAGLSVAQTAYGAAEKGALDDAKTFASQNADVRSADDVSEALDADSSMTEPKSTGNWADDFLANPFGVKGALAKTKRNAASQLLNEQATKNRTADHAEFVRQNDLLRQERLRQETLAREEKQRADDLARADRLRAADIDIADRRRREDAEQRSFQALHDDEERAKDRRAASAERAADRAARVDAAQAEANARAAQRAEDKAAAQAIRDAEYQRNLTDKQKQQVADVENFRTNIKDNVALLKKQVEETGTFELFGPESADMERRITSIATDMAKLADPGSVAREGEVATAKRGLFPTGTGALFTSNKTAQQVLDNLAAEVDKRAENAYRVRGLPPPSKTPSSSPSSPSSSSSTPASDPMMLVVFSDGTSMQTRRSQLPSTLPDGVTVTEAH